jgi:hypothetical protein
VQNFDDVFLALKGVEGTGYKIAEQTYPHDNDYRIKGFSKDFFHIAFSSHRSRLQNILKTPELDPIEKTLLKQRLDILSTRQEGYVELQRKALAK